MIQAGTVLALCEKVVTGVSLCSHLVPTPSTISETVHWCVALFGIMCVGQSASACTHACLCMFKMKDHTHSLQKSLKTQEEVPLSQETSYDVCFISSWFLQCPFSFGLVNMLYFSPAF